jgi:hypothetical protein
VDDTFLSAADRGGCGGLLSGQSLETVATVLYWANWILLVWILLLFPAVAIGEESDGPVKRVETAIRRGRGHFWLFIRSLLMTLVPLFLALLVIVLAINATQTSPNAAAITPVTLWLIQAGWWAILVVTAALAAAAAAWLYSHLTESHLINEF